MATYYDSTGGYPDNPEDYISVPRPDLVNPGPVTTFDTVVLGTAGNDNLSGTAGNDRLDGGAGNDLLYGGLGDDSYYVTVGDQVADDGGIDTIYFGGSGFWRLAPNFENIVATGTGPTDFRGNNDANVMIGNDAENYFNGRAGDDTMIGLGGNDHFDMSTGRPSNAVDGLWTMGMRLIDGGDGIDTIDYDGYARSAVTIDLGAGTASGGGDLGIGSATLISIEDAVGGQYDDRITGSSAPNDLYGRGGNDTLVGVGGNDKLDGGVGDDSYYPTAGDVLVDASGNDTVYASTDWTLGADFENLTAIGSDALELHGNNLANVLTGNDADNLLVGAAGNDRLIGGLGFDVAQFSGSRSAYAITKDGAGVTVSGPDGVDTLTAIERLQFDDAVVKPTHPIADVNADGKSDIIAREPGQVDIWQMDGSQVVASTSWGAGSLWSVPEAHGDYNGDGSSDVLLTTPGEVYVWQLNGTQIATSGGFGASSSWHLVGGLGDFNGDGNSDIVLRHDNGTIGIWFMNGASIGGAGFVDTSTAWSVVGSSGDYNGDGKSDFLVTSPGAVGVWQMDGASIVATASFAASSSWSVIGTRGDYNGDGKSDVVLRNADTGSISVWLMDGTQIIGSGAIDTGHPDWQVLATDADFNADGKSDLLIRENGMVGVWQMNGTQIAAQAEWGASSAWTLHAGTADYNGDGKSDIVLQNQSTGDVVQWLMNGTNIDHSASFHMTPGTDLLI